MRCWCLLLSLIFTYCCAFPCGQGGRSNNCFYVRQGAAGTSDGSDWTNAFPSLPSALQRNSIYFIADGNYSSRTFDDLNNGETIFICKATAAEHGTDTGWSVTYGDGRAVFGVLSFSTSNYVFDGKVGGGLS